MNIGAIYSSRSRVGAIVGRQCHERSPLLLAMVLPATQPAPRNPSNVCHLQICSISRFLFFLLFVPWISSSLCSSCVHHSCCRRTLLHRGALRHIKENFEPRITGDFAFFSQLLAGLSSASHCAKSVRASVLLSCPFAIYHQFSLSCGSLKTFR